MIPFDGWPGLRNYFEIQSTKLELKVSLVYVVHIFEEEDAQEGMLVYQNSYRFHEKNSYYLLS